MVRECHRANATFALADNELDDDQWKSVMLSKGSGCTLCFIQHSLVDRQNEFNDSRLSGEIASRALDDANKSTWCFTLDIWPYAMRLDVSD